MYMGPKVGFLGVGHLGSAVLRGLLRSGAVPPEKILLCDASQAALSAFPQIACAANPAEVAQTCGLIFLCVRPDVAAEVLRDLPAEGKVILSAVAGLSAAAVRSACGANVLRIMPNLAVELNEGAVAYADPSGLTPVQLEAALAVLEPLGTAVPVPEDEFNTVTGLSGSGPAYAYLMLEGMIAGACRRGLAEDAARLLAAQTLRGAAAIVLSTDRSLESLVAGVATPGGTTAAGVRVLEESGFAEAASWAVDAAAARAQQLSDPAEAADTDGGNCVQLFAKDKFCE